MLRANSNKILIFGWDGASFDYMQDMLDNGLLPNLSGIISKGFSSVLKTTPIWNSCCAWPSISTGVNPGKHSIYDFYRDFEGDGTYFRKPVDSTHRRARTFWEYLSDCGFKVGLINLPITYPPTKLNGFMVTGMLTPHLNSVFTWPPNLSDEIREHFLNYRFDIRGGSRTMNKLELAEDAVNCIRERLKLSLYMINKFKDLDCLFVVFTSQERALHFLIHSLDMGHPYTSLERGDLDHIRNALFKCFSEVDNCLGTLVKAFNPETTIVVSDHGFASIRHVIILNKWLEEQGFLHFKPRSQWNIPSKYLRSGMMSNFIYGKVDWKRTIAYSVGHRGMIYVNMKGREPQGTVKPEHKKRIVEEIIAKLKKDFVHPKTREKLYANIVKGEQVFSGPFTNLGPDIIIYPIQNHLITGHVYNLDYEGFVLPNNMPQITLPLGTEVDNGILCAYGVGVVSGKRGLGATVYDISPTILHMFGQPVPLEMDGHVLIEMFKKRSPVRYLNQKEYNEKAVIKNLIDNINGI